MEDELKTFFFDSYALIEIFEGNRSYEKYKGARVITSYFHIYELNYILRKKYTEEDIEDFLQYLESFCVELDFKWIGEAVAFRRENKKRDLSYADCLGYIIAEDLGVKFLTGDNQFRVLKNVEFVK